jgi:ubiquinone/menaquinone biosynthesis C-methylase UbiE
MKADPKTWEKLGEMAPYYSVLVADKFRPENLSAENLSTFFDSGRKHLDRVMEIVRELNPQFMPRAAIDFGCGVGRVTIPLAETSARVLAVDVSEKMLEEARKNCAREGLQNVTFLITREFLQLADASADFVHSFIVLQHIPPSHGYKLIEKLLSILQNGGIGALHVTFRDARSALRRLLSLLKRNIPGATQLANLMKGRPLNYPAMPMYNYSMDKIFRMLHETGCHKVFSHFTNHGQHLGIFLIFKKSPQEMP